MARMGAFKSASFRRVWCSSLVLTGASLMERVATGWLALQTGGGALAVGVALAARMLPSFLLGLSAGTVADRTHRGRFLLVVGCCGALVMTALGLIVSAGVIAFWEVVGLSFASGCIQVFDTPARQTLVVDSIDRPTAPNAIALNAVASRLSGAAGAFFGGVVIPTFGVADCYFLAAAGYLVEVGLLGALAVAPRPAGSASARTPFARALASSWRLILEHRSVRMLVLAAMACEVFGFSYGTVVPAFARDVLRAGPEAYGAMTASAAIGATIAVLILALLPGRTRREPFLAMVYLLYGLSIVALAASPTLAIALIAMLAIGGCASAFDTLQQTLLQLAVPDDKRGRAVGIWTFSIGTAPVGHLEVGALAGAVGVPTALLLNGALVVAGSLLLVVRAPSFRLRRAPAETDALHGPLNATATEMQE